MLGSGCGTRRIPGRPGRSRLVPPVTGSQRGDMPRLLRRFRHRHATPLHPLPAEPAGQPVGQPAGPLPAEVAARVRLSADLVAALLEVEQRSRVTLDDLEWADAVAARLLHRRAARREAAA